MFHNKQIKTSRPFFKRCAAHLLRRHGRVAGGDTIGDGSSFDRRHVSLVCNRTRSPLYCEASATLGVTEVS